MAVLRHYYSLSDVTELSLKSLTVDLYIMRMYSAGLLDVSLHMFVQYLGIYLLVLIVFAANNQGII